MRCSVILKMLVMVGLHGSGDVFWIIGVEVLWKVGFGGGVRVLAV